MTLHVLTVDEKLRAVESHIELLKYQGSTFAEIETFQAIAADLRARLPESVSVALVQMERKIVSVHRSKMIGLGYSESALVGLANETIARWPAIRHALSRLAQTERSDA